MNRNLLMNTSEKVWQESHNRLRAFIMSRVADDATSDDILQNVYITEEWYFPAWLGAAPHAPVFQVRDTENKYGRYAGQTKSITIKDLIKFHGHFCGGLVESAAALRVAFDRLFVDDVIDRTDLRIASNNSACGGDVASYLTGSRTRFNSHLIDSALTESEFYVQQVSTGKTVHVKLNPAVYPKEVKTQMKKIESGTFEPKDIDLFQELQWAYAKRMVHAPHEGSFLVDETQNYAWPEASCKDLGKRKDNDFKNTPTQQARGLGAQDALSRCSKRGLDT